jgi:hypothetical protein
VIVSVTVFVIPLNLPVKVTRRVDGGVVVVTGAVVLDAPKANVAVAGIDANAELSLSETFRPDTDVGPARLAVTVAGVPPATVVGATVNVVKVGGRSTDTHLILEPPSVAVNFTAVSTVTRFV